MLSREAVSVKISDSAAALSDALDLPPEATGPAARITLYERRRAVVEHHDGLLGYTGESVEVRLRRGSVRILGSGLALRAMDADALLITGAISAVEYA